ncbi:MAG: GTPase HflX [Acidilobaceae archaeon]
MADKAYLIIPRSLEDQLEEAKILAEIAGYEVVRVWRSRYTWRLGRGLIEDIAKAVREDKPSIIIFYGDLKPSSSFQITKKAMVRVIDRVLLILEIFTKHAGTREALLQIEMARIKHELPLIRELIRRSKLGELPGFLGPGGYAIDSYYKHLTSRLSKIRRELEKLRLTRRYRLESRREKGFPHVVLVGYASAGKTSIFNKLTGDRRIVGEEYFTTLHPKHTAIKVNGFNIILIDTIGFIRDIPPEIIEAFHIVLEEIKYSDAIIFVVDISEDDHTIRDKVRAGIKTLAKLEALGIPLIIAANKVDKIEPKILEYRLNLLSNLVDNLKPKPTIIPTSATLGSGLNELVEAIAKTLGLSMRRSEVVEHAEKPF